MASLPAGSRLKCPFKADEVTSAVSCIEGMVVLKIVGRQIAGVVRAVQPTD